MCEQKAVTHIGQVCPAPALPALSAHGTERLAALLSSMSLQLPQPLTSQGTELKRSLSSDSIASSSEVP